MSLFSFIKISPTYGSSHWMMIRKDCQKRIVSTTHREHYSSFLVTQCQINSGSRPKLILEEKSFQVFVYFKRTKSTLGIVESIILLPTGVWYGVLCEARPEKKDKERFFFPHFQTNHLWLKNKSNNKKKSWGIFGFSSASIFESSLSVQNVKGT